MKRFVIIIAGIALVALGASPAAAQHDDYGATAPSFAAPITMPFDGSAWVSANGADRGLGFQGSYLSTGVMMPLFMDSYQGTYFIDGRGHVSENGGFFSNLGFGRRQHLEGLGATMGVSMWYDYDGDQWSTFGHDFNQLGFSFELLAENWNYRLNAYFPIGNVNYEQDCFVGHNVLVQNGIDRAFRGLDSDVGFRLPYLEFIGGMGYLGGYFYENEGQKGFGGFRSRITLLPLNNMFVNLQINTDHEFKATGLVSATWYLWGGQKAVRQGSLMTPTFRNDHIVRKHQDPIAATNPNTGALYNVVHVDNTAGVGGDGTVEHPYNTLLLGQTNSAVNDMIFVHRGDGSSAGQDMGITLKNNQLFFGEGVTHKINTVESGVIVMCADMPVTGQRPLITNPGGTVVTLASNNEVSGFLIQDAVTGIGGNAINHARIFDNVIQGMQGNGVQLTNSSGNFNILGNRISTSTLNGIAFQNTPGEITVGNNFLQNNGIGASSGLLINNNAGDSRVDIFGNNISGNGTGITMQATAAARIIASIHNNSNISSNLGNGIVAVANTGSRMKLSIANNPSIDRNGTATGAGTGIRMFADNAVLTASIVNNQIKNNAGDSSFPTSEAAGIYGNFTNNSNTNIVISDNFITGSGIVRDINGDTTTHGDGIQLNYDITNVALNTLLVDNNQIIQPTSVGYYLNIAGNTHLAATQTNNTITDATFSGVWTFTSDNSVVSSVWRDNTVVGNGNPNLNVALEDDGFEIVAFNASQLHITLQNNIIRNNGDSPNFGDNVDQGIDIESRNTAIVVAEIFNNRITGSADEAVRLRNFNAGSQLWALVRNNLMTNNNRTPDFLNVGQDFIATNSAGVMRVELTNNVSSLGYRLVRNAGSFLYEDNGNVGNLVTIGGPVQVPQGTIAPAAPVITP